MPLNHFITQVKELTDLPKFLSYLDSKVYLYKMKPMKKVHLRPS